MCENSNSKVWKFGRKSLNCLKGVEVSNLKLRKLTPNSVFVQKLRGLKLSFEVKKLWLYVLTNLKLNSFKK